jgi:hypothetical protein
MTRYEEGNMEVRDSLWYLVSAPFAGLVYVISLPVVAIAAVVTLAAGKAAASLADLARRMVAFGWRPTEAYLSGKKKDKKTKRQ